MCAEAPALTNRFFALRKISGIYLAWAQHMHHSYLHHPIMVRMHTGGVDALFTEVALHKEEGKFTWQCHYQERSLHHARGRLRYLWGHATVAHSCPAWRWTTAPLAASGCKLLQGPTACAGIQALHRKLMTLHQSTSHACIGSVASGLTCAQHGTDRLGIWQTYPGLLCRVPTSLLS